MSYVCGHMLGNHHRILYYGNYQVSVFLYLVNPYIYIYIILHTMCADFRLVWCEKDGRQTGSCNCMNIIII